ncbi:methionine--tRNA ligase mes1, partial [Conglomerata obtusa]
MTKTKEFKIITSALPYVNNLPHLGNVVGCVLSSDVYYRYCKMMNQDCIHICGTDEYGTATEMKAIEMNLHPKEICEINSKHHKEIYGWFNIEFSLFGRTSESLYHEETVHEIFNKLYDNGFFEEIENMQQFCGKCELFLADRYVKGECLKCGSDKARGDQCDDCGALLRGLELKNPKCSLCDNQPVYKNTKHLYLKLDSLKNEIKSAFELNGGSWSQNAREITKQWLNIDLQSRCMTRDLKYKWGVSIPKIGYENKVFYVWFDAPIGYLTFTKEFLQEKYNQIIRDKNTKIIQFMGKDNVTFHSIIFPGMLIGTKDNYKLVNMISSTEYLLFENEKFSKSRGVGIFGGDLLNDNFGESCFWRFYLMKIRPEIKDTNFTFEDFKNSINSDLINNLGNFINRTLKYIKSKMDGKINWNLEEEDKIFIKSIKKLNQEYHQEMENCGLKKAIKIILDISSRSNEYLQTAFNDVNNKKNIERKNTIFSVGFSVVYLLSKLLLPFIPISANKISEMLQ